MRGFLLGVVATILVATACSYAALRTGLIPANADANPGWFETWATGMSLDATLARDAPKGPNPVALTDTNLIVGIDLYGQHCAICHGERQCFGDADRQGQIPVTSATGDGRGRGRSRGLFLLENIARHPLDRHALVEGRADRRADLGLCSLLLSF